MNQREPSSSGAEAGRAIGIDIGGTKIAGGVVQFPQGKIENLVEIPTRPDRGGAAVLRDVEKMVATFMESLPRRPEKFFGISIGICELVDREGEIVSSNCFHWKSRQVREVLGRFGPVGIEADVRAAALAEALFGAGVGAETFLFVTVGTGISSCLVIQGKPFTGTRGGAGTMASGLFPTLGEVSSLTLEAIASGPGLVAGFKSEGGNERSAYGVLAAAKAGNEKAQAVVRRGGRALGSTIGMLVNVLDPELVIVGGGLGLAEGIYRRAMIVTARKHIWWDGHRNLKIVSAATGHAAGVIGAAAAVWQARRKSVR